MYLFTQFVRKQIEQLCFISEKILKCLWRSMLGFLREECILFICLKQICYILLITSQMSWCFLIKTSVLIWEQWTVLPVCFGWWEGEWWSYRGRNEGVMWLSGTNHAAIRSSVDNQGQTSVRTGGQARATETKSGNHPVQSQLRFSWTIHVLVSRSRKRGAKWWP